MMCCSDKIQAVTLEKIEESVERDTRIRRWQEYTHFKVLGRIIQDAGMNRFETRKIRDAYREAVSD
jgi:hypothetical protein